MNRKKLPYTPPAIKIVEAAPSVMYVNSEIIHQHSLSSADGDITVDEYEEDETVELESIFDYISAAKLSNGGVWDEDE
ncbi:MAG: hypothetical protein J5953_12995 [Prevotella sp.]|nr:hypothetical protein [Prevotella sp.]